MELELTKLKVKILSDPLPGYKIAAECGIHPTTMSGYAQGQKGFTQKHLLALCRYFECDSEELTGTIRFLIEG